MQKYNAMPSRSSVASVVLGAVLGMFLLLADGCAEQPSTGSAELASPAPDGVETAGTVAPVGSFDEASAAAGSLSLRADAPLQYVVKHGDTLWGIASYFLRDPWQWPQLWFYNGQVRNPHLIYPGQKLVLITVNGHLRLADSTVTDHLQPQVRSLPLDQALPAIPIEAIRDFLRGPRLVTKEEISKAPYVVEFTDEHIDASANESIYVENLPTSSAQSWAAVQIGDEYRDPDTNELLGYEAIPAGEAELRHAGQPAEMLITKSAREVLIGDRLLPLETESFDAAFYPHPPAHPVDGRIISVFDGVEQISQYQIVALNRGSNAGLDPGTVLSIYQIGRTVQDPYGNKPIKLPEQYAGVLMVFKVAPKLSYGLVLSANKPAHVLDKVHQPMSSQP